MPMSATLLKSTLQFPAPRAGWGGLAGLRRLFAPQEPGPAQPLGPRDTGLVILHFATLDTADRIARFNANLRFDALSARYRALDWASYRVLGVRLGRRLIAVAELAPTQLDGRPARELALSVQGPWQHSGVGERLMRAALAECHAEGVPMVVFTTAQNHGMIHLAEKFGGAAQSLGPDLRYTFAP